MPTWRHLSRSVWRQQKTICLHMSTGLYGTQVSIPAASILQRRHDDPQRNAQWHLQRYRPTRTSHSQSTATLVPSLVPRHSDPVSLLAKQWRVQEQTVVLVWHANQPRCTWVDQLPSVIARMNAIRDVSTHWRATCNFPTDGVDFRDYWRVSLKSWTC